MAGIGFALRELTQRGNLVGSAYAYGHAVMITSGPWLMTILAVAGINVGLARSLSGEAIISFRTILIYNFCFSLVLIGPLTVIATRSLADMIFRKSMSEGPGLLLGLLAVSFGIGMAIAGPFYMLLPGLTFEERLAAIANFQLVGALWCVSIFLTALKDYTPITMSFGLGMISCVGLALVFQASGSIAGLLWGVDIGIAIIVFLLIGRILAEYPYDARRPFAFLGALRQYWPLLIAGAAYNLAAWVDKWIMWFAPEARASANGLIFYHHYDGAMFFAYLTMIPSLALFTVSLETNFFERYRRFYTDIANHATLARIKRNHADLVSTLREGFRNVAILQVIVAVAAILAAPRLVTLFNMDFQQIGMFRFGVVGVVFHTFILLETIVLSYFDLRRENMRLQLVFLATNAGATLAFLPLGFPYYGYGYFVASLITAAYGMLVVKDKLDHLPYVTFVENNAAVR